MPAKALFISALLALTPASLLYAGEEGVPANALLVLPSDRTAFDRGFQDFLDKGGVRLTESYPPSVYVGYVPAAMDARLTEKYGAKVYRGRVDDWASFAQYGEKAVYAVNAWNKRFIEDPPAAPMVVSSKFGQLAKGQSLYLSWNEVMKAVYYRLQVAKDKDFSRLLADTVVARNTYRVAPGFWPDGVYYWRAAGVMTLNNGDTREGAFSQAYSFALPALKPSGRKLPQPSPAENSGGGRLRWDGPAQLRYYRLQLSDKEDFEAPLVDVFTDTTSFSLAGLPLESGETYYGRVMGSDGRDTGGWSKVSKVTAGAAAQARDR